MSDRLVCAADGTARSAGAICTAFAIGRALGMRTVLVHVAQANDRSAAKARTRAAADLERSLAGLPVPPDTVRRIEVGDPAELVVAAAEDEDASIILTGTREAGARAKAMFGSVASRIVELARVPVVIAPQACCDSALAGDVPAVPEVIIAVDGSDESRFVAALAARLAKRARAEIVLAHVVPPLTPAAAPPVGIVPPLTHTEQAAGRRVLQRAWQALPDPDGVEVELLEGVPSRALEELSRERGAGLIVLGTRRPGRVRRLLSGSIADELAASGERPVMVIPDDVARRASEGVSETTQQLPSSQAAPSV